MLCLDFQCGLLVDIDVSIDGTKEAHEKQRGPGTYRIAIDGARALYEVASHISITITASKLNYKEIARDIQKLAKEMPFVKSFNLATTSPANYQEERMTLNENEMKELFSSLVKYSKGHPVRLVIYLNKDMEVIMPELKKHAQATMKFINIEWKINNLTIAFFPPSIACVEEYALDANGMYVLPYGLDHYLELRPDDWQMNNDLIVSNPKEAYRQLSEKYFIKMGERELEKEKYLRIISTNLSYREVSPRLNQILILEYCKFRLLQSVALFLPWLILMRHVFCHRDLSL